MGGVTSLKACYRLPALGSCILFALLGACTQQRLPLPELRAYSAAVSAARSAGDDILDDYALVEIPASDDAGGAADSDEPLDLLIFSTESALAEFNRANGGGDPPDTALRREVFASIEQYTSVLLHLAEGRSVDELSSEVDSIGQSLLKIGADAAIAEVGKLVVGLDALKSVLSLIETQRSQAAAMQLWLEGSPTVVAMVDYLQSEAAPMFEVITEDIGIALIDADGDVARTAELTARLEQYQRVFVQYVGLLQHLKLSIAEVDAAIAAGSADGAAVARLQERALEISITVRTIREAFARIRTMA